MSSSILIVDPNPVPDFPDGLRRRGFEFTVVHSGAQAVEHLRTHPFSLTAFRFHLGDMSGADLCRQVRSTESTKGMSMLLLADSGREDQVDLCMAAGCNDILFRPIRADELESKIRMLTSISQRMFLRTLTKVEMTLDGSPILLIGHTVNVSATGMLIELDRFLAPESDLRVSFYLPNEETPMVLDARVFRAEFDADTPRYGLHFTGITAEQQGRIEAYMRTLPPGGVR